MYRKQFKTIKIGDKGYKISYSFDGTGLHIMKGIVHEIEVYKDSYGKQKHSFTLRSELPCTDDHINYMDSFGYNYVTIKDKCYPLSWGCRLYSSKESCKSFFAKDKKELSKIKSKIKKMAIKFATEGF